MGGGMSTLRPLPSNGRYLVSSSGEVTGPRGHVLRPWLSTDGYRTVSVAGRHRLVHRLVAEAYIGASAEEVDHIDGDRTNNSLTNLRYLSHAENVRASAAAGRLMRGEAHVSAKLDEREARAILTAYWRGEGGYKRLASRFNRPVMVVRRLVTGETWKHLARPPGKPVRCGCWESRKSARHPNPTPTLQEGD